MLKNIFPTRRRQTPRTVRRPEPLPRMRWYS
jgi:hypothetical protein